MRKRLKLWKKWRAAAFLAALTVAAGILSHADIPAVAAPSTREQIEEEENIKKNLENELGETNENLEGLKNTRGTLMEELGDLNSQLENVSENLAALEKEIFDKEEDIRQTKEALEEARAYEAWQYACMVIRIREMYEMEDGNTLLDTIFGAGTFGQMLSAADYFEMIEAYDQRKFAEYKENRRLIEEQEARLENDYADLQDLKMAAEEQKNKISGLISYTASTIAGYEGQISEAEQKAREMEAEIRKKEENLEYLRKKLAEEMAMSRQAANATWRDISEVAFAEGDRYLLANLIYCEAGGEPYEGQVAVGSVVMNRVLSSVFPNTIVGVIYQQGQFSPVASGRLALALAENRATERCYQAADEAMSGVTNVGNCVFFRTPIEGLTGINIGGHVFY